MKAFTDIITILDRSGSMESIQSDTEGGFNAFVQKQRETPGACALSLYQFDDVYEVVYENRPIAQVPPLQLEPRNMTALLDAIGSTVNARGAYYASTLSRIARGLLSKSRPPAADFSGFRELRPAALQNRPPWPC